MWGAIVAFVGDLISFFVKKFSTKTVVIAVEYTFLVAYYTAVIAFYLFILSTLSDIYNLITNVLHNIQILASGSSGSVSSKSSCIFQMISHLLSCSGFIDGINQSKPIFFSAILFVFTFIFYKLTVEAKRILKNLIKDALRGVA